MKHLKIYAVLLFISFLLMPFVNCGSVSDSSTFDQLNQGSSTCSNGGCISNETLLELSIDVGSEGYSVASNVSVFNVSGRCNDGGFTNNSIGWRILQNGTELINSNTAGTDRSYYGKCNGGTYNVTVRVPCPGLSTDGTNCFGLQRLSTLEVEIFGLQDDMVFANPNRNISGKAVNLTPGL